MGQSLHKSCSSDSRESSTCSRRPCRCRKGASPCASHVIGVGQTLVVDFPVPCLPMRGRKTPPRFSACGKDGQNRIRPLLNLATREWRRKHAESFRFHQRPVLLYRQTSTLENVATANSQKPAQTRPRVLAERLPRPSRSERD